MTNSCLQSLPVQTEDVLKIFTVLPRNTRIVLDANDIMRVTYCVLNWRKYL